MVTQTPPLISPEDLADLKRQTDMLHLIPGLRREAGTQGGEYSGPCPNCGGTDRFHVQPHRPEGALWMCRQCTNGEWGDVIAFIQWRDHCSFPEAVRRLGGPTPKPAPPAPIPLRRTRGPVIAMYDYPDEVGQLLFQVRRHDPKEFTQRRPDGRNGWIYKLDDVRRVLYNLPAIVAAPPDEPIWVCEGEKDANRAIALGLVATTNPGGAKKWRPEYSETLRGRSVVMVPDADPAGQEHVALVAPALAAVTDRLKVLALPDLAEGKKDLTDWLDAGHTLDDLLALAKATPRYRADPDARPPAPPRPVIRADGEIHEVRDSVLAALQAANDPPTVFQRGRNLVRVVAILTGGERYPQMDLYIPDSFRPRISEVAQLVRYRSRKRGEGTPEDDDTPYVPVPVEASHSLVQAVLTAEAFPFPVLDSLSEVPVVRPDGSLHNTAGYDPATRLLYTPAPGLVVPPVPAAPTAADVAAARALLFDDLLVDFPFTGAAERANAIALFLLPFCRPLIPGPTPLHLIESPTPGSGKSLLAEVLLRPAFGEHLASDTYKDEEETGKWLTAKFHKGSAVIWLDNIRNGLNNSTLASALTTTLWSDRLLGVSQSVDVPVRCVWVATANNPTLTTEIARRTVRIRIDPRVDRPQLRTDFRHPDIRAWVSEQRGPLIAAALTLIRAWVAAGKPAGTERLGSYEAWTRVVGGILAVAGIPGFLTNALEVFDASDVEGSQWRALVELWYERYNTREVTTSEVFGLAGEIEGFNLGRSTTERGQRTAFGMALLRKRDTIYTLETGDQWAIQKEGKTHQAALWQLKRMSGEPGEPGEPLARTHVTNNLFSSHGGVEKVPQVPQVPPTYACVDCGDNTWTAQGNGWVCGTCGTPASWEGV